MTRAKQSAKKPTEKSHNERMGEYLAHIFNETRRYGKKKRDAVLRRAGFAIIPPGGIAPPDPDWEFFAIDGTGVLIDLVRLNGFHIRETRDGKAVLAIDLSRDIRHLLDTEVRPALIHARKDHPEQLSPGPPDKRTTRVEMKVKRKVCELAELAGVMP